MFDGFKTIASNAAPTTIPVSGFQTPPAGPVRTTLGFVSYEGDLGLGGDTALLNTTTLFNAANQATNFFNGSISNNGVAVTTRNPAYTNTMGYDSDLLNANGILANSATSASIGLTTNSDQYLPGVVTFATELFAPAVSLVKSVTNVTHPGGPDQRGDVLRYTVTASNTGQDGAQNFILSDPIPANATYVPGSLRIAGATKTDADGDDTAEFAGGANQVVFRLGTGANATVGGGLAPNVSVPVSFDVRIGDVQPRTEIVNAASATYVTQSLRVPLTADSNPVTNVVAAPDLSITKRHTPDFVAGGDSRLRLVVSNVGNLPSDGPVTVTDPIPPEFASFANPGGDGWACSTSGRTVTCTRSDVLADGDSFPPIFIDVTIPDPAPASIVNTATVAGGGDVNPDNNTATDVGGSAQQADLRVSKTALPTTVLSGQTVQYTLTVSNAGPSTATAVTVDDPIGAGYTDVTAVPSTGTCTAAVTCSLGDLARGESATITITATVTADATTLTNTATVSSPTPDPVPSNNQDSASIVVPPTADLRMTKTPSTTSPTPGQPNGLTYTMVATNAGPSAATGVVITDVLPPDFTPTTIAAPTGFTCTTTAGTIVCSGGTIAAGASATLTVTGTVAASPATLTLVNAAQVRADTADPDDTNNADTSTVDAKPQADIGVTKVWGLGALASFTPISTTAPNTDVQVLLTMTNFGPSPATGAVLTDPLPAGVTFVSSDQPATCSAPGGVITCNVGPLASGETFTVLATVHVATSAAGTTLTNTATGKANEPDPVDSNNTASDRLSVGTAADLAIQKRANLAAASVGDTVTFTLSVTNNGPNDAAGVVIRDVLPAGLTFVSSSGCTASGATVTCTIGTLASGATIAPTVVARVERAAAGTTLTNNATVSSTTQDPDPSNNTDAAAFPVAPQSDLSVVKRPSAAIVPLFTDVTYTLTVANDGPNDATGVTVTDGVPAGMVFVSADPSCTFDAGTASVTCAIGALADGASQDVTITLRPQTPNAGHTVPNTATVTGDQPDPNPADNSSDAGIFVPPQADLAIEKTASAPSVAAGDPLTYTLRVTNAGPNTATAVTVEDPMPAFATATTATASQGGCTTAGGKVTCTLGDLAAGGEAQITIVVAIAADAPATTLHNTATVDSDIEDPRPEDNSSTASTTVIPSSGVPLPPAPGKPALSITKTVDPTHADTSDRLTYRITVANRGTATATGVVVTDTFGRSVRLLSVTTTAGTCTRKPLSCHLGSLAAGAHAAITIVARPLTAGTLTNGASVTAANAPGAGAARVSVAVAQAPTSLSLRKRASPARVPARGRVSFRLTVRNRGTQPALAVRVCDRLPNGLTFSSAPGAVLRGRTACWRIAKLAGHHARSFTIHARADNVSRVRRIRNRATAKGSNTRRVAARARIAIIPAAPRGGGVTG